MAELGQPYTFMCIDCDAIVEAIYRGVTRRICDRCRKVRRQRCINRCMKRRYRRNAEWRAMRLARPRRH